MKKRFFIEEGIILNRSHDEGTEIMTLSCYQKKVQEAVACELSSLRRQNGLTGKELAKYIGISQQQISRYELGICSINIGTLAIILNIFNCSLETFFKKVNTRIK
ncbi:MULTISPECIES: helix-turn-helix domain-containing protein [Providencia]|uniref:helix-turn-helix domain-containing protein n=1 Tax=Providencia TaxID=586 RepID=UPI001B3676C4|nr:MULTISPECIES: helix-turn-helix transcriptional regulator [Providencia]EJD6048616.1 helix-turn-helix transcriptional regulator [Providencia rettgeri]EJD6477702.1 helix-turn-helix transcriptional regulator [Providencia rettgeri]ELH9585935.1 helix-turn-helix transcriptional regulator [Providencia rettgeri]ELM3939670.1 helix-turn-helix transcriptional regulator [Providencia rettgeri]ELR5093117.1 helix-turn-helix transcriptional regulator [Providencia rettgeri]